MNYFLRDRLLLDLSPCIKGDKKKRIREREKERKKEAKGRTYLRVCKLFAQAIVTMTDNKNHM